MNTAANQILTNELPLMEAFYTIQGEGFHQGKAAYFIRLAGCDVGCHWCDVKESWDKSLWPIVSIENMVAAAAQFPGRLAVVTGGEPLMHDLTALTNQLKAEHFQTNIETSGAYPLTGTWDWVCLSPKKFKDPVPEIFSSIDELKVIIYNKSDFDYAEKNYNLVAQSSNIRAVKYYLQPEWSKMKEMNPLIIDYIKANPQWEISLQMHKFLDIP